MPSDALRHLRRIAVASLICATIAACSHSESKPSVPASSTGTLIVETGDTDAAIANALAVLGETRSQKPDYAAEAANLIEGIINEDPQQIGVVLTRLMRSLPATLSKPATEDQTRRER